MNVSLDSSDEHTTSDVDSVEATTPPIFDIVFTNPQDNYGVYPLGRITKEDEALYNTLKPDVLEDGFASIDDLHNAVQPLHLKYFHSDLKNLFAMLLNWFFLFISLSKDHNRQEEFQEVINVFSMVEATAINLFQDNSVGTKWHFNTHGPFTYVQSLYFLVQTIRPKHSFEFNAYPRVKRFQVKRPTRSDADQNRVSKFDEMDASENEASSSNVVLSSLNPFHQDMVTCCKTLLKASDESNNAILPESRTIIEQAKTLLFYCFEPSDHTKITEILSLASTRLLFLHFKHLRSFGKTQESSQLDEKAGDENNEQDNETEFNKTMFCVVTFSVDEDIGTSIDYCGTQPNGFSHYTTRAPANYKDRGCGLMNFLLHVTQCIGWIVSRKLDTYLICPTAVSNFYRRIGFKQDPTMATRNELEPFCIRFDLTNLTNLKEIHPMLIIGKPIKRRVEKLIDMRSHHISSIDKAIFTEFSPPEDFFPHNFITEAIDDEMKRNVDGLGRDSCE
eukprot:scaffold421380_cov51-Attheya_sp.AAC.1